MRSRAAFSLVEVLVSLALLAALLVAANHFAYTTLEAWAREQQRFAFVRHTQMVSRHVRQLLQTAVAEAQASGVASGLPAIAPVRLPEGGTAELLTFDLAGSDRHFDWSDRPLPEVRCALGWRSDTGLLLYFKSLLEEDYGDGPMRQMVLSPLVTGIAYDYYDEQRKTWLKEAALPRGSTERPVPRRIRLQFQRGRDSREEIVPLPLTAEGLPAY